MAKGNPTATGAKNQQGNNQNAIRTSARQITLRSMMERGKQLGRTAKNRAAEQILGKNAEITTSVRGGPAMLERAKGERMKQFKEARKKLEEKKKKAAGLRKDAVMSEMGLKDDREIKQEMLDQAEPMTIGDDIESDEEDEDIGMEEEEKAEESATSEIRMDGEEFTADGKPEKEEEYKERISKEEKEINRQKAEYTDEEWEKVELEVEKERQRKAEEELKRANQARNEANHNNEESKENSVPNEEEAGKEANENLQSSQTNGEDSSEQSIESNDGGQEEGSEVMIVEPEEEENGQGDNNDDNQSENQEVMIAESDNHDVNTGAANNNNGGNEGGATQQDGAEKDNDEAQNNSNDEGKPQSATAKVSFAGMTSGEGKQQYLGAVVNYEHTCRFEISAVINGMPKDASDDQQAAAVKDMIISILKRFKNITKRVAIQPWYGGTLLPSILRKEDISEDLNVLKDYIAHEGSRSKQFRNGRNSRLLVNVTFDKVAGGGEEIEHLWQQQTKERRLMKFMPINLKVCVMQSEQYYPLGALVNSGEKQVTTQLEKELSKILKVDISIAYRDVPAEYRTIEKFWVGAKGKAGAGNIRGSYMWAPQAMVVYTNVRAGVARLNIIKELMTRYGKMTASGEYPTFPDGSKMRFIPPEAMAPVSQRYKIRDSIKRQIDLRSVTTTIDMEYSFDINKIVEKGPHKGKSLGALVLGLTSSDIKYGGVPFFKHFVHKWAMDFRYRGLAVAVFTNMAPIATEIMGSLQGIMEKAYGPEVGEEIKTFRGGATLTAEGDLNSGMFQIQLDDDDWFEKTGKFVLTGIFNTEEDIAEEQKKQQGILKEPTIKVPSGAEVLMDTHSIITMNSLDSNVTSELAGGRDSNQGGMPAGRAKTGNEVASKLAEEAEKSRNEEEKHDEDGKDQTQESDDEQSNTNERSVQQGNDNEESEKKQESDKPSGEAQANEQENNQNVPGVSPQPIPVTPRRSDRNAEIGGGRGRGGGRGSGSQQGRGRGGRSNRPPIISPQGKSVGNNGGSGPIVPEGDNPQSEEWTRTGTEEDEENLRKQFEQQPAGAAVAGEQP